MPASTPVFGITYPCSGEDIECTAFQTFTQDIQDAINTVSLVQTRALTRPSVRISDEAGPAFPVAVLTDVQWSVENYDNNGMANLGVDNTAITIQTNGWYVVSASVDLGIGVAITSAAVAITQNTTVRYRRKSVHPAGVGDASIQVVGLIQCVAGDVLRAAVLLTGVGSGSGSNTSSFSAYMVVPT